MSKKLKSTSSPLSTSNATTTPTTHSYHAFKSKKSIWPAMLMVIALVAISIITLIYLTASTPIYKYAIVIDAGSTHSEANLFRWKADKLNSTGQIEEINNCEIEKGISTYTQNELDKAADKLVECIQKLTNEIDPDEAKQTLVYLGATAGMRVLELTNSKHASQILDSIQKHFAAEGLNSKNVSVIKGEQEGLYAWIASNYLAHTFFNAQNTYGVLDMGGASAQIAHEITFPRETKARQLNYTEIKLYGKNYKISSYSNLCFGTQQALYRYYTMLLDKHLQSNKKLATIESSCFNIGHRVKLSNLDINNVCTEKIDKTPSSKIDYEFVGTGNIVQCREIVESIVNPVICKQNFKICLKESLNKKEGEFYAISTYAYLSSIFNPNKLENLSKDEFIKNMKQICTISIDKLRENGNYSPTHLEYYCFRLALVYSTLTKVYHFDDSTWAKLKFSKKIKQKTVGWALGYMIEQSNVIPAENGSQKVMSIYLYATFCFCLAIFFVLSCVWFGYNIMNLRKQKQSQLNKFGTMTPA